VSAPVPQPRPPEAGKAEPATVEAAVDEALAAAIVATVLAARAGTAGDGGQPPASRWADRAAGLGKPLSRGPDAWRFSLR